MKHVLRLIIGAVFIPLLQAQQLIAFFSPESRITRHLFAVTANICNPGPILLPLDAGWVKAALQTRISTISADEARHLAGRRRSRLDNLTDRILHGSYAISPGTCLEDKVLFSRDRILDLKPFHVILSTQSPPASEPSKGSTK